MSRLDDLIDLIQTTNEVYFITAPGRVRTAYILVDDIVELAMKTFLQEKALEQRSEFVQLLERDSIVNTGRHRGKVDDYFDQDIDLSELGNALGLGPSGLARLQPLLDAMHPENMLQHWSVTDPDHFVRHHEVVRDVRKFFPTETVVLAILDAVEERHGVRNTFYHDHRQAGLTIDDDKCLRALCGMFDLMEQLYPGSQTKDSFRYLIQRNKTTRCQIGVLRLKLAAQGSSGLEEPYKRALDQFNRERIVTSASKNYEHSVLHTISERFFIAIRSQINSQVDLLQKQLGDQNHRLTQMRTPARQNQQRAKIADTEIQLSILTKQLGEIDALMALP